MTSPIHHLHQRKRVHLDDQSYPHPHRFKRFLDKAVYVVGAIAPMVGSVQAYKIWNEQTAEGVSLSMFGFNIVNNIVWLCYATAHKERPILVMYSLWLVVNIIIVSGILTFR